MSTPASDIIPAAHARSAWAAGIDPLREAFPPHVDRLLRAIAFSHIASLPVPVFIIGGPRSGKSTLARAIGDLAGELPRPPIARASVSGIKQAVQPGAPLIVDDAAPASSRARPGMFDQLEGETYAAFHSRLHEPSIFVATGDQPISELSASRIITIELPARPRSLRVLKAVSSEPAIAGRRYVASYLHQQAGDVDVDDRALSIAGHRELDNLRRLGAALYAGDEILRALSLEIPATPATTWLHPDDQITWAVRSALRYLLELGGQLTQAPNETAGWPIGRIDEHHIYLRPAEALSFIRAAHGNETLSIRAIAGALRRTRLLTTDTGTIPMRIEGRSVRVWRISKSILG